MYKLKYRGFCFTCFLFSSEKKSNPKQQTIVIYILPRVFIFLNKHLTNSLAFDCDLAVSVSHCRYFHPTRNENTTLLTLYTDGIFRWTLPGQHIRNRVLQRVSARFPELQTYFNLFSSWSAEKKNLIENILVNLKQFRLVGFMKPAECKLQMCQRKFPLRIIE